MLTLTRDTKRLTIIVIYIFLLLGLAIGGYFLWRPEPTCFDAKQNQNETGIDCGGVCALACVQIAVGESLVIREVTALPVENGTYDAVARIYNPNNAVGAESFTYTIRLFDGSGNEVGSATEKSWILPQETKTLLSFALDVSAKPTKATLEIKDVVWRQLTDYDGRPKLGVYSKRYEAGQQPGEWGGVVLGLVTNESGYDFRLVTIKVILRGKDGEPLAINQTNRQTFLVGQQHEFRLTWPAPFPGDVAMVETEIDADVYHSDNFLRRYVPAGRSQEPGSLRAY